MKYAVVIEHAGSNYSAYVPDLPGCVATGSTVDETRERIAEAVPPRTSTDAEDRGDPVQTTWIAASSSPAPGISSPGRGLLLGVPFFLAVEARGSATS